MPLPITPQTNLQPGHLMPLTPSPTKVLSHTQLGSSPPLTTGKPFLCPGAQSSAWHMYTLRSPGPIFLWDHPG